MANLHNALSRGVPGVGRIIDGIRNTFLGAPESENGSCPAMLVTVKCGKCGEHITVRVDKANDLQCEFHEQEDEEKPLVPKGYILRKEVLGKSCQNLVRFGMQFDGRRRVVGQQIEGGEFVDWQDTK